VVDLNIYLVFYAIDFIVRLMIVIIFFVLALTFNKTDPDIIRSRLFLEYDRIIKAFNLMSISSFFFFVAAVIEYFIDPTSGENLHLIMHISLAIFQISVIYFIFTMNRALNPSGKRDL
jgi:hypothetical protein